MIKVMKALVGISQKQVESIVALASRVSTMAKVAYTDLIKKEEPVV